MGQLGKPDYLGAYVRREFAAVMSLPKPEEGRVWHNPLTVERMRSLDSTLRKDAGFGGLGFWSNALGEASAAGMAAAEAVRPVLASVIAGELDPKPYHIASAINRSMERCVRSDRSRLSDGVVPYAREAVARVGEILADQIATNPAALADEFVTRHVHFGRVHPRGGQVLSGRYLHPVVPSDGIVVADNNGKKEIFCFDHGGDENDGLIFRAAVIDGEKLPAPKPYGKPAGQHSSRYVEPRTSSVYGAFREAVALAVLMDKGSSDPKAEHIIHREKMVLAAA